jgi:CBS domain-containing protein
MTAKDVMSKNVVTCGPETRLAAAARLMRRHKIGFLPVVDNHGAVVGVITDRDISNASAEKRAAVRRTVSEVIAHPVYACLPDDNLKVVLATMAEHRVRRLPVLDKEDRALEGVISIDDIVRVPQRRGWPANDDIVQALKAICGEAEPAESAVR